MADDLAAAELARRLKTAHTSLNVALAAVIDVIGGLIEIIGQPHLTTQCDAGRHGECPARCSCSGCREMCDCTCHLIISGLRVPRTQQNRPTPES